MADTYKTTKEFKFSNVIATVHIPDLSEEERDRRIKAIQQAAMNLLKERKQR